MQYNVNYPPGLYGNICTLGGFLFYWRHCMEEEKSKKYKTLDEKVNILKNRGLKIDDASQVDHRCKKPGVP
jgi:hypothetical protein